jgi:hypothetical protein
VRSRMFVVVFIDFRCARIVFAYATIRASGWISVCAIPFGLLLRVSQIAASSRSGRVNISRFTQQF